MIPAHDGPLAALAFSPNGTKIATASEKGTVIRVFSVSDGSKLYEFRRGMKRCVAISCLAFSMCSQYLGCSSNTETVHVFKLEEPKERLVAFCKLLNCLHQATVDLQPQKWCGRQHLDGIFKYFDDVPTYTGYRCF